MDEISKDVRFSHLVKDPRFRKMQKHHRKVKIDKRFQSMFNDQKFKMKYTVDKRGRPVNTSTNENLKKYYELSSEESEDSNEDSPIKVTKSEENRMLTKPQKNKEDFIVAPTRQNKKQTNIDKRKVIDDHNISTSARKRTRYQTDITKITGVKKGVTKMSRKKLSSESEETGSSESDGDAESEVCEFDRDKKWQNDDTESEEDDEENSDSEGLEKATEGPDYARGEGLLESSSDDESQDEILEGEQEDKGIEHAWGELDKETPLTQDITSRLAVCNMDWDRIKAHDIMVLLNSFKSSGGTIKSVHVYPSEFGVKRMAEEDMKGPTEIIEQKDIGNTNSEDSEFQREKLREYQLKRLKYYYAVVQCDNAETANHIYDQCDGLEYESTSNRLDLRFIPDDMEFDQEPKSVATDIPDVALYKPKSYVTSALQQSKVQCTWDETDHDRLAVTMRKFNKEELEDMDLKDYIASDSDDEPVYQANDDLAADMGESESEDEQVNKYRKLIQEMNEKEKGKEDIDMEITWEPGLKENTEKLVKKKAKEDSTPWENYLEKKKENKKMKREKKKQADLRQKDPGSALENSDSDIPPNVDLNDSYFKEELVKMDQTDEKQKKQARKKKKRNDKKLSADEQKEREQREAELKLLLMDEDDQRQHFSLKQLMSEDTHQMSKSKRKKLKKKKQNQQDEPQYEDNFEIDVDDPRFKELFENPHYNIDPSAPEFKKTKAVDSLIEAKQKMAKRKMAGKPNHIEDGERLSKTQKLKHIKETSQAAQTKQEKAVSLSPHVIGEEKSASKDELARLIKSVKAKTEVLEKKKKKRLC